MTAVPASWGFLGLFAGPWKLAIVAAVVVLFYGRAIRPHAQRFLRPTTSPRPVSDPPGRSFGDRVYLLLIVVAATAVATWIVTKLTILQDARPPR